MLVGYLETAQCHQEMDFEQSQPSFSDSQPVHKIIATPQGNVLKMMGKIPKAVRRNLSI